MERYERLKKLKPELFKRLTGVKPDTFEAMLKECEIANKQKLMGHTHFRNKI